MGRASRRGCPCLRLGGSRRGRFGPGGRTSQLPWASRPGGGFARPASRAAELAAQATAALAVGEQRPGVQRPNPAALAALAWVHLEHNELRPARSRLKQVDAALGVSPDKLIGAVAFPAAARSALAEADPEAAAQFVARARSGWPVPAWLDHRLSLAESRACLAAGDIEAALAAANGPAATARWKRRPRSRTRG